MSGRPSRTATFVRVIATRKCHPYQCLTRVSFIGITGRSCLAPLIMGEARKLMFQKISLEPGEKINDSRRMDKTSSTKYGKCSERKQTIRFLPTHFKFREFEAAIVNVND